MSPTNPDDAPYFGKFDLVLDKGTYDAITLAPALEVARTRVGGGAGGKSVTSKAIADFYAPVVSEMMKSGGLFLITSCNWTEEELVAKFKDYFEFHSRVKYPSFTFGGVTGQKITTIAFRKK
ncbi:hypothetical protein HK102_003489 [Quaeritorhiza haematococci]|nr:hypothetical protein HK102_003489 [Quaeritorhiza haematococci]